MNGMERWERLGAVEPADVNVLPKGSRVGHAQRDYAARHLNDMAAQGFLTEPEREARTQHVLAAATRQELDQYLVDLPPPALTTAQALTVKRRSVRPEWVAAAVSWWLDIGLTLFSSTAFLSVHHPDGARITGAAIVLVLGVIWAALNVALSVALFDQQQARRKRDG